MVLSVTRGVALPFLLALLFLSAPSLSAPLRGRRAANGPTHHQSQLIRLVEPLGLAGMPTLSAKDITKKIAPPKSNKERLHDAALRFLDHYQPFLGTQSRSYKNRKATLQPFAYPPYFDTRIKAQRTTGTGKLVAFPQELEIGQDVTLTYTGITPQSGDFIAIYCPPNPEKGPGDYIDTVAVDPSNSGTNPPNTVQFSNLMNMRCDYAWNYIQNSTDGTLTVVASSNIVKMKGGNGQPLQGHLSYLGDLNYAVTWNNGNDKEQNEVLYGTEASSLSLSAPATSWTYAADSMCGPPSNTTAQMFYRDPGYMHSARLPSLSPRTTYYYKFGNSNDGYSSVYSFTTAPSPQASTANVTTKFIALADMGVDPNAGSITAARVTNEVEGNGFNDFLLHFGDISYARGNAYTWEQFFELIQPYATRTPYQVSVGNHEYDHEEGGEKDPSKAAGNGWHPLWGNLGDDSSGECGVPTYQRFRMPDNGNSLFWYSFDYGNVHIIQISTEHDWTPGSELYNWLEKDLQSVNRTQTPWVILTGHRPMYSSQQKETNDYTVSLYMRQALEELIYKYKVNMMMTGHYHSYERSCAIYRGQCVESGQAPMHVVVGTAGAGLESGNFTAPWSRSHLNYWGYTRLTATAESLHMDFVRNDDGSVYDSVTLKPWY